MNRIASATLLAGLLAAIAPGVTHADPIIFTSTPFSGGTDTDYTQVGFTSLPFTDSNGTTVNGGPGDNIIGGIGLNVNLFFYGSDSLTWSSTNSTSFSSVGFTIDPARTNSSVELTSITLSNGDSLTGLSYQLTANTFLGFTDTSAFSSATLTFSGRSFDSGTITHFTFLNTPTAVPEPSSLVMCGLASLIGSAYAWRRRKRTG
jgi:hypothetical protein